MTEWQKFISRYFQLSKKETNGFLILSCFMIIMIISPLLYQSLKANENSHPDTRFLDSLALILEVKEKTDTIHAGYRSEWQQKLTVKLKPFDPNLATEKDMTQAGLPPYLATRIIKYRSHGGRFNTKSDLRKIYGIEKLYEAIKSSILLPDSLTKSIKPQKNFIKHEKLNFDINLSDSSHLEKLKGIGAKTASRIIRYRNKLGGFIHKSQYNEIFGLDSFQLNQLTQYTFIKPDFIPEQININKDDLNKLAGHPYIGYRNAKLIIAFRQQHGAFVNPEDLLHIKALDTETTKRLLPYIRTF